MSRSNVETSKDAPIDAVGDDAVSNMLDVTGDQPSHQEWKNQFVQKTPFIALIVWVLGILFLVGTTDMKEDVWSNFKGTFSAARKDMRVPALVVCFPFAIICNNCITKCLPSFPNLDSGPGRIFASVVIVFVTLVLLVAKPVYNNVHGGSVSTDPATHCTFLADELQAIGYPVASVADDSLAVGEQLEVACPEGDGHIEVACSEEVEWTIKGVDCEATENIEVDSAVSRAASPTILTALVVIVGVYFGVA
eukprot:446350_1